MDFSSNHDFLMEVRDESGKSLHQTPLDDLARHIEDAKFCAVCAGAIPGNAKSRASVSPLWSEDGRPYISGIEIEVQADVNGGIPKSFRKAYVVQTFRRAAVCTVAELLSQGGLEANLKYDFKVSAFKKNPSAHDHKNGGRKRFRGQVTEEALPLAEKSLSQFTSPYPDEMFPVFVSDHLLKEIGIESLRAEDKEQAGILLGQLCRDPDSNKTFLVVTAQVLATEKISCSSVHFQFSPETFVAAQQIIDLRKKPESVVGWWHSHAWCANCDKRANCEISSVFFSTDDYNVQEAAFDSPYTVALVVGRNANDGDAQLSVKMFGWQDANVRSRSFRRFKE